MTGPIDEQYLAWLYAQVASLEESDPTKTYWSLFRQLYGKEFVWLVLNDDNRVEDGKNLRDEFLLSFDAGPDPAWMELGCSVLEMLIALSRHLAFEDGNDVEGWFWEMLENLDLVVNDDEYNRAAKNHIDYALDRLIWRSYLPDGRGGLFPLDSPTVDQRDVEIWLQFNAYIIERS